LLQHLTTSTAAAARVPAGLQRELWELADANMQRLEALDHLCRTAVADPTQASFTARL
jgi:hypothetical protein